ncbi:MAG TPA: methylated-DNA--[protein]-cysteine S-methyltransferase [Syntrophales bacterium]|nr:methylated-DNA--[protein]-cysteine S-methyltransferase [Syntrophales bacterium]
MDSRTCFYHIIASRYGEIGLMWKSFNGKAMVEEILLPREGKAMRMVIEESRPASKGVTGQSVPEVAAKIAAYLQGKPVFFSLNDLGRQNLTPGFRQDVLLRTLSIPLGMIDTYGGLATKTGHPKAARAVGTVMAQNPFPLVIPCHRVIRSDGKTGCYGGGAEMKRQLLAMEGVTFDRTGRVARIHVCRR